MLKGSSAKGASVPWKSHTIPCNLPCFSSSLCYWPQLSPHHSRPVSTSSAPWPPAATHLSMLFSLPIYFYFLLNCKLPEDRCHVFFSLATSKSFLYLWCPVVKCEFVNILPTWESVCLFNLKNGGHSFSEYYLPSFSLFSFWHMLQSLFILATTSFTCSLIFFMFFCLRAQKDNFLSSLHFKF